MNTPAADERLHHRHHAVQFYRDDAELFRTIGTFLSEGLVAGQPAIVVATPDHTSAIQDALGSHLIDVARARHFGDLVMLDAEDTLGTFMHKGMPDQTLFQRHVGAVMEQTVRVGLAAAPQHVDHLATKYSFSLLCGYAIESFSKDLSRIEEVCHEHTHVLGNLAQA